MAIVISAELQNLLISFQNCLDLRDKYMDLSLQRLGDDLRDHDAKYIPLNPNTCDVAGFRPDTTEAQWEEMMSSASNIAPTQSPWKVYPPPPPPHWHPNPRNDQPSENPESRKHVSGNEEFDFAECDIPGADEREYALDTKSVFQVYTSSSGTLLDKCGAFGLPLICCQILPVRSPASKYPPSVNISWTWTDEETAQIKACAQPVNSEHSSYTPKQSAFPIGRWR